MYNNYFKKNFKQQHMTQKAKIRQTQTKNEVEIADLLRWSIFIGNNVWEIRDRFELIEYEKQQSTKLQVFLYFETNTTIEMYEDDRLIE